MAEPSPGRLWETQRKETLERIVSVYPVLLKLAEEEDRPCAIADQESVARFFDRLESDALESGDPFTSNLASVIADEPVCGSHWQQAKLLACSAAASFCGPTALLCGWGCWCMLCGDNSAVADAIC